VASLPQGQQIHIIADNLSAHRTIYVGDAPGEPGPDFPGDQVLEITLPEQIDTSNWRLVVPEKPCRWQE
jgi:hypothetical protein